MDCAWLSGWFKKRKPLVSVIVPLYNAEAFIERALLSILMQDYKNVEVIVVDDCSTDRSMSIVNRLVAHDPRIQTVRTSRNCGVAGARNMGLALAKGKYVMSCDSDDYYMPGYVSTMVDTMEHSGADLAQAEISVVYSNKEDMDKLSKSLNLYASRIRRTEVRKITSSDYFCMNKFMYDKILRRSIIEKYKIRFPMLKTSEDMFFICAYVSVSDKIAYVKRRLYCHLLRRNSLIGGMLGDFVGLLNNDLAAFKGAMDFALAHNRPERAAWIREDYIKNTARLDDAPKEAPKPASAVKKSNKK
ncbi:MAG: glycosyltransferase [Alphaproteobacteria bacterium]|nr:glycosyltransferase [Alphaproteobacteria bacterium]